MMREGVSVPMREAERVPAFALLDNSGPKPSALLEGGVVSFILLASVAFAFMHSRGRELTSFLWPRTGYVGATPSSVAGPGDSALPEILVFPKSHARQELLDAFATHNLVLLGDRHASLSDSRFRIRLMHEPRFAEVVRDVVVDFGNARHQALLDRYVAGEDVAQDDVAAVWRGTTQPRAADSPVYAEFFWEARQVNLNAPEDKKIRLWAADPPIEWENVRTHAQWADVAGQRDQFIVSLIEREILAKHRKALVIAGAERDLKPLLDQKAAGQVFAIVPADAHGSRYDEDIRNASITLVPSLVKLKDAPADACLVLGAANPLEASEALYDRTPYGRELMRREKILQPGGARASAKP